MIQQLKRKLLNQLAYYISYVKLYSLIKQDLSNTIILDCGANQGSISALFARTGAQIFAFEPDPLAFSVLEKKFLQYPMVECVQKAVWINEGTVTLYLHMSQEGKNVDFTVSSSIIKEKVNVCESNAVEVATINLLEFIRQSDTRISVLKMDIEGAEVELLNKIFDENLHQKIDLMLVETHENKIPAHVKPIQELKQRLQEERIENVKLNWI
ncbi:FkbM family methyltransferase [Porifericola rhodea]|uniref:FkbM family methyltransferase n=1 Tax=Porifericola rhodea TaxID=930972 RepID=UPI00266617D1|nr:FkbM family methyltransferase [Porifericola rhodea]WKN31864.1 FkbM family methyltransferase [Porifericola rhodea]